MCEGCDIIHTCGGVSTMPRKKVVTESKVPIVEVLWQDAIEIGEIGWNDLAELRKESRKPCPTMRTVGYCVYYSETHIAVLNTLGGEECSRLDKIPTGFIQSVEFLRGNTGDVSS